MKREKNISFLILFIAFVIFQLGICSYYGFNREYLFCDEVFSYGLSNCEEYPFIDPKENQIPIDNWVTGDFFTNYLKYNEDVDFSFRAAFANQARDVHPPLYYCLLHLVCSFFRDHVYGPLPGIVLNLILLVLVDIVFFYVARYLLKSRKRGFLAVALWALSSAGISNVMLIRMYLLQTLEIMLFIAFHVYVLKNKKKMTIPYFIALACIVALGGLTHYYFYFFAAAFGGMVCIYLLFSKQIKNMLIYGISLVSGLGLALLIFPATLRHIFGYRGAYATHNLGSFSKEKILSYLQFVNKSLLAGKIKFILVIVLVLLVWRIWSRLFFHIKLELFRQEGRLVCNWRIQRIQEPEICYRSVIDVRTVLFGILVLADAVYAYIAIQGSEIVNTRYIYPAYPVIAILVIKLLSDYVFCNVKRFKNWYIAACCLLFCYGSIRINGVEWLYEDYDQYKGQMEAVTGDDSIIIYHDNGWNNVYECIDVLINMESCRYLMDQNIELINNVLDTRPTDNPVLIIFPGDPGYSREEKEFMLNTIIELTDYTGYGLKYNYIIEAYELY